MKKTTQLIIIVTIFIIGITIFLSLTKHKASPKRGKSHREIPVVKVIRPKAVDYQVVISASGEVYPIATTNIAPQISGKVIYVSPNLKAGRIVKKGEILIKIEDIDYKIKLSKAISHLKETNATLIVKQAESKQAIEEWNIAHEDKQIPPLAAKLPQLESAKSMYLAAKAEVLQAKINLKRTKIVAPYTGVIQKKYVSIGDIVSPSKVIANMYPISEVEIHIPVSLSDLEWIDVPGFTIPFKEKGSEVDIEYFLGNKKIEFSGNIIRSLGEIDKKSRMLYVVASIKKPFAKNPPLLINTFVRVKIKGKLLKDVYILPLQAIFNEKFVLKVVKSKIVKTKVNIIKILKKSAIIKGIGDNDKIIISPIYGKVDGMKVKVIY